MKRSSNRFWKEILGDAALVERGFCIVNLYRTLPYYAYVLVLIPKRLTVRIEAYRNNAYKLHYTIKFMTERSNYSICVDSDEEDLRYYMDKVLKPHDPKELMGSVEEYYSDHSTSQYKISTELITTTLSEFDLFYSEFCQGEFRFWLRGIKVIVDVENQCNIVVKHLVNNTVLATYAGNKYGLRNFKSRYFN